MRRAILALTLWAAMPMVATAGTVYSTLPGPVPQNVPSQAFEATETSEWGGLVRLGGASGPAPVITVLMSSWGCESGSWTTTCTTTPGATFSIPITLNVRARGAGDAPGALLATQTKTFAIPYRPSSDPACATSLAAPDGWTADGGTTCSNGRAVPITFDPLAITLPAEAIVTVAFNTTHAGYVPIGEGAPCFTGPGGCGYDSLNVGAGWSAATPLVGALPLPDDTYLASTLPSNYCDLGAAGTGPLRRDDGCWTGFQPNICVETAAGGCLPILDPYVPPAPPPPPPTPPPPTPPPVPSVPAVASLTAGLVAPARVTQGNAFRYTLTVTNTGSGSAQAVTVRLTLPRGVSLLRLPAGARISRGVLTWRLGTLPPGTSRVLRATVRLDRRVRTARVAGASVVGTNVTATATARATVRVRVAAGAADPGVTG